MSFLPHDRWQAVVRDAPLVSIDLIVQNPAGEVLLGKRLNRPAQGFWFVPGGCVRKGETLSSAFSRLAADELGITMNRQDAVFAGVYEHHYTDNFSGSDFGTHYVVLAHRLLLESKLDELPVAQHGTYCWMGVDRLLQEQGVHPNVKDYFRV